VAILQIFGRLQMASDKNPCNDCQYTFAALVHAGQDTPFALSSLSERPAALPKRRRCAKKRKPWLLGRASNLQQYLGCVTDWKQETRGLFLFIEFPPLFLSINNPTVTRRIFVLGAHRGEGGFGRG
jgi:hypothetical protein